MSVPSFPRQSARTQNFTLGTPKAITVSPDGTRVSFLRSPSGTDGTTCLWVIDVTAELEKVSERLVADPAVLLAGDVEELTTEERARRERSRTTASGIVEYATDEAMRIAAFALSGRLFVADLDEATARELPATSPVLDPRPSPTGEHVAYVNNGTLRVVSRSGADDRPLAEPDGPDISWGVAEFIAQEEMGRSRGYWWAPDGRRLLVARVDTSPVQRWHIGDPANPDRAPTEIAYPAAGTPNASVELALVDLDGSRVEVVWDTGTYPYLVTVHWSAGGPPLLVVMSRDQRHAQTLAVDFDNGLTTVVASAADDHWLDVVPGVPQWTPDGRLVTIRDDHARTLGGERRVYLDNTPVTSGQQVRGVLDVTTDDLLIAASEDEPSEVHVFLVPLNGDGTVRRVSPEPGVHGGRRAAALTVLSSTSLSWSGPKTRLFIDAMGQIGEIRSVAETPPLTPLADIRVLGERALRTVVLYPDGHVPGSVKLPVLMDPYGGPHAQRVVAARNAYLVPQWIANHGFAVLIADGAGTPGRGPAWEREVFHDLAGPVLDDQVAALHAAAATQADLDLSRVGIRGWSFGGYLAALAVLRRPDVFHAAIAGAPVTDWTLYDTFYTERYLGTPDENPEAYERSSILSDASKLSTPLLLIHGLADDNVVAAHTLRLSSALLAAGRPHTVLPLSGVTHMTPQEVVAENLLLLQVEFLKSALG